MNPLIESLEGRRLLSTSPTVAALAAGARQTQNAYNSLVAIGKNNFKIIEADLKLDNEFKSSGGLLKKLGDDSVAADKVLTRGLTATSALIAKDVKKLESAAAALAKKPASAALQAKVSAAGNTLSTDAANRLSIITGDVTAEKDAAQTNVEALLTANPSNTLLKTDVDTTISLSSRDARTALTTAATTTLTTDVNAVIAAFPA